MAESLYRLGRFCTRRARAVIAAWVVVIGLAAAAFVVGHGALSSAVSIPGTETARVTEQLGDRLPEASGGMGTVVFHTEDGAPLTADQRAQISALLTDVAEVDGVRAVTDPFRTAADVAQATAQLESGRAQLAAARRELDQGTAQLDAAQAQVSGARALAEQGGAGQEAFAQLDAAQAKLDAQRAVLDAGDRELTVQEEALQQSADLMALAAPIRTVSEDETAALAAVVRWPPSCSPQRSWRCPRRPRGRSTSCSPARRSRASASRRPAT
ncbi:MAG: hypothetical protein MUC45_12925 [Actinomycetia bacterium]|nr:hypothetical protein [Actinomycetes bacterium]